MEENFSKNVRPVLDLVDKLREIGISKEISLPQIAVMGDQSSGKSSVLQSISGIPFPRGSGLVTRCPLELIMKKSTDLQWKAEVSVRWERPEQPAESGIAANIDDLLTRIQALSNVLSESGINGFSRDSIVIRVSSPDSPDLTLIDLPGIVRTSTAGQDAGVIEQVNSLIDHYISQPNTIILAVVPSNQDIATIDILERASHVDTSGIRTVGVLTKPDLIGPGNEEEVLQVLLNKRKPLQLGYTIVKNASQKQLNEQKTSTSSSSSTLSSSYDARKDEDDFFQNHSFFGSYYTSQSQYFGVKQLITKLTKLLITHIKRTLPTMLSDIRSLLSNFRNELTAIGGLEEVIVDVKDMRSVLSKKIAYFNQIVRLSSKGDYRDRKGVLSISNDVRYYGEISKYFKTLQDKILVLRPTTSPTFTPAPSSTTAPASATNSAVEAPPTPATPSNQASSSWKEYSDTTAQTNEKQVLPDPSSSPHFIHTLLDEEMTLQRGRELPGFLSTQVFSSCMVHLIEEWRYSVDECASNVISTASTVISNLSNYLLKEYPILNQHISSVTRNLIDNIGLQLRDSLEQLIIVEQEPFTTQEVLLEVVNSIRFRTFDTVLRQIIDSIDSKSLQDNKYLIEEEIKKKLGKVIYDTFYLCISSLLTDLICLSIFFSFFLSSFDR